MSNLRRRLLRALIGGFVIALFVGLYIGTHSSNTHACATPCDCAQPTDRPCP